MKPEQLNFSEGEVREEPYYIALPKSGKVPIDFCHCGLIAKSVMRNKLFKKE